MLSDMDMDDIESEESDCFSSVSSEESSEEVSYKTWDLNEDQSDEFRISPQSPVRISKNNFLQKLYYREIGGYYAPHHSKNFNRMHKPSFQRIKLADILPLSASKFNHVFLGMSKCGQFLLSYTYTTEWDVMSFNTVFKYRLHWWAFTPHQKARKVSEVMLFGNHGIYSTLFIAVCQWPLDYTRVLIYGNCCETYMGSASQAERSYLTITTVPSLNKCQDCLKVAASYEEEDLAANWDSCVRFSCLKHSVTVHSTFDVVSPYPKFDPAVSMKRDGTVVFNTGNQLHVLRAELVYVDGNSPQVTARSDPMVCLAEPSNSDNTQNKQTDCSNGHELWVEETKLLPKLVNEKCSDNQNGPLFSCPYNTRSHNLSPSVSLVPSEKTSDCKDGANVSCNASCNLTTTSDKKYDEDEDELDEEEITTKKGCSDFDSKHFSLISDNKAVCADSCDMPNKLQCTRNEDGDFDKICVFTKGWGSDGCNNISNKKSCDTSKQCDTSSCRSELETVSVNNKIGKEKIPDDSYVGRITRSQASRRIVTDCSSEEDLEVEVPHYKKYLCPVEDAWNRETHTIDSTQELNISCGTINSYSESSQSTVTLMSPVQKSLLIVGPSEEGRCGQASQSHSDPKHVSSPPRRKMLRSGNPVKFYSSPMPPSQPKLHSKMAAEAEKAYEFTDDIPDTTGEKLSSYRKRRLADKKYEFIEEGEDLENIVPYRLHRRREPTRHRSPPLLISPSPVILNHRRRHLDGVDSEDGHFTGQRVSSNMPYNSLSGEIHSSGNHLETDKVVLRPLNQNTSGPILLSPRDRDTVGADRTKTSNNKKSIQSDVVGVAEDVHHSTGVDAGIDNIDQSNTDSESDGSMVDCTVQLKRHYIEVDDELISVITDIEDDDVNEGISYHCALPLEVHGAGYAQLQMISNSKAEKLMAPCVRVLQRSFDVEQFCHKIAERLCEESGKKYWFCNDYDVEIVDVCPLSGDVLALAMMRIQATVKTKGLAKSQRHPVSSQQRRQYQGGCHFVWNLDTGDYSVVDTKPLAEVDSNEEKDPWNPARDLAKQLRQELPQVPVLHSVRHVSNKPALRGVSATRYEDSDHMIELVLQ